MMVALLTGLVIAARVIVGVVAVPVLALRGGVLVLAVVLLVPPPVR